MNNLEHVKKFPAQKTELPLGELTLEQILRERLKFMTLKKFCDTFHQNLRPETVGYWIRENRVHWFKPGRERFIVLTEQSLDIQPNKYVGRR